MAKEIDKVHIRRPADISVDEARQILRGLKVRGKVETNTNMIRIHVTTLNDNGIFNLGMKMERAFSVLRIIKYKI